MSEKIAGKYGSGNANGAKIASFKKNVEKVEGIPQSADR
jgi:hypothetical protein